MKVTLESTDRIVELLVGGAVVPARVWEGKTERGIPVFAYVTRIAPAIENPSAIVCTEFERDLRECRPPQIAPPAAIPTRLIL